MKRGRWGQARQLVLEVIRVVQRSLSVMEGGVQPYRSLKDQPGQRRSWFFIQILDRGTDESSSVDLTW